MTLKLTNREYLLCPKLPEVLRALADDHACREVEAEAIEQGLGEYHKNRRIELQAEADRIQKEWEDG